MSRMIDVVDMAKAALQNVEKQFEEIGQVQIVTEGVFSAMKSLAVAIEKQQARLNEILAIAQACVIPVLKIESEYLEIGNGGARDG